MAVNRQEVTEQSDEALESQIVSARAALRHDVMLLEEKLSPSAIVERRRQRLRHQWTQLSQRTRRRAEDLRTEMELETQSLQREVGATMEQTMSETKTRVAGAREKVGQLPRRAITGLRQGSTSRPMLFAGAAFLAGWGISRALPMTRPEQRLAGRVGPIVEEKAGPIIGQARTAVTQSAREAITRDR